jgi:1-pyrroline-5-carboxylate dehydrogenase
MSRAKLVKNYVQGSWTATRRTLSIPNPLTGRPLYQVCDTSFEELTPYINEMRGVPHYGLHNPFHQKERYLLYGQISKRLGRRLEDRVVFETVAQLIKECAPKSDDQIEGEVGVTRKFLENFSGDQVRFLARSFGVPGDHQGQASQGFRFPYGPVAIVAPFNFPLEIPVLQLMGALFMGNKPLLHVDPKVSAVMAHFLELMLEEGMPPEDVVFVNGRGSVINRLLVESRLNLTQFTGSSAVGERLTLDLKGRVKLEDSGFDWKILAPDVVEFSGRELRQVYDQCDRDAYAFSGQKCSAQSMLFAHDSMGEAWIDEEIADRAMRRTLSDLTVAPLLSISNAAIQEHLSRVLSIPGARLLFGGHPVVEPNSVPSCYGCFQPTAVGLPLEAILDDQDHFETATSEIFGPFQIITFYSDISDVLRCVNRMDNRLTAAVVSKDPVLIDHLIGKTVNGTTYVGPLARTTGAPQNHWFGPGSDPRSGSLGTPEAIRHVWSYHREVIGDFVVGRAL